MGHYLSACAMLVNHTGNSHVESRLKYIVSELQKVQDALGEGYLSAFPREHFLRLQDLQAVWAPFYVIHKIMAGLLDAYNFLGVEVALKMVEDEAEYFRGYYDRVIAVNGTDHWLRMLETEFGGMNEVLFNLYDITNDPEHIRLAEAFTKPRFFQPLLQNTDPLPGLHANTHLAQVNGFAARFEKAGHESSYAAVTNFFSIVTRAHSFATGGNNDHEFWGPPRQLADSIVLQEHATETEETCTQYNMLKIARYLFRWTGAPVFADYYERAILNGLIGTQRMPAGYLPEASAGWKHPLNGSSAPETWIPDPTALAAVAAMDLRADNWRTAAHLLFTGGQSLAGSNGNEPGPGVVIYLLPMGSGQTKGGSSHGWGDPLHSFWCCYGTSVESFAKLADSIFFFRQPPVDSGVLELYINQLTSATLASPLVGLSVQLEASFFQGAAATANITFAPLKTSRIAGGQSRDAAEIALKLRIPSWAVSSGVRVEVNGQPWAGCTPTAGPQAGSFCTVRRVFSAGDRVVLVLPMSIRAERVQDDRPEYSSFHAVMMGPLLMAGLTHGPRSIEADPRKVADLLTDVSSKGLASLVFSAADPPMHIRHDGTMLRADTTRAASSLDSTFRLLSLNDRDPEQFAPAASWSSGDIVILEAASMPGVYVHVSDGQGAALTLRRTDPGLASRLVLQSTGADHKGSVVLELADRPGMAVGLHDGGLHAVQLPPQSLGRQVAFPATAPLIFELAAPLAQYPHGAKLLTGGDRQYIVAPLMNIVEDSYTPYFDFHQPSTSLAMAAS
ncbi:g361 [Coccomyxa elongata]